MSDIFFCYSRTDISVATKLMQRLEAEGWDVFIDKETPIGRRWHEEIEKELHAAKTIVVLWSANSRVSNYVLEEAEYGSRKNILFPAFIESVEYPYGFSRIQTADLIGWEGNPGHPGLMELLKSLRFFLKSHGPKPGPDGDADAKPELEPINPNAASEITSHNNVQANAEANNNQAPKKRIILWLLLVFLGIVIFLAVESVYDNFFQREKLPEKLIGEETMTPQIDQEATSSKKIQTPKPEKLPEKLIGEETMIPQIDQEATSSKRIQTPKPEKLPEKLIGEETMTPQIDQEATSSKKIQTPKPEKLPEKLIGEETMIPQIDQEATSSKKIQTLKNDLLSDELLPDLVLIPAGSFSMGEQDKAFIKTLDDAKKPFYGIPGISVDIKESFYLGKTEVTYEQYDYYVQAQQRSGQKIKSPERANGGRGKQPVVFVSWRDAVNYAAWVGKKTQQSCRLPTEAEWEYAARAGSDTAFYWGDEVGVNNANCIDCGSRWGGEQTAPVGQFDANPFGLHDMSGNVMEWTCSSWHDRFDGSEQQCNDNMKDFQARVLRGGSWSYYPDYMRSAARYKGYNPDYSSKHIGFRVLCSTHIE